jgi:uncharacterized DUF497 family protein
MLYNEIEFEWDEQKFTSNLNKHGIDLNEAVTIWGDLTSLELHDHLHSVEEERWIRIGFSNAGTLLVATYTERETRLRLISARKATQSEAKQYHERRIRLL